MQGSIDKLTKQDLKIRKSCKKNFKLIMFDLKGSSKLGSIKRNEVAFIICQGLNKIREQYPDLFAVDSNFVVNELKEYGYFYEPWLLGDAWALTLKPEVDENIVVDYFKKLLLPKYPFYWGYGYYEIFEDFKRCIEIKIWDRRWELYYLHNMIKNMNFCSGEG